MNNRRQKVRKHISAARDWLGRAEHSIDKENDVRSDLNMMLAQAELKRAQETKTKKRWKKWFVRLAPLLVAVALGLCYVLIIQQERARPIVLPVETVTPEGLVSPESKQDENTANSDNEISVTKSTEHAAKQQRYEYIAPQSITVDEVIPEQAKAADSVPGENKMPSEDMQRLMQEAGKTLRE